MQKILSLIIPTYNMSLYIERCLQSLLSDGTNHDLEILVINDGSTDDSPEKAKRMARTAPQTIRVIDKPNGNYGSCINRGLKEATGKYIKILDADDYFDKDALHTFINELKTIDADLVLTDHTRTHADGTMRRKTFSLPQRKILSFPEICQSAQFVKLWMHSVAYRREIFSKIEYNQTEGISYTDQEWIYLPLTRVRTAYYIPVSLYYYVLGREGQTMSAEFMERHFEDHIICLKKLLAWYTQMPDDVALPVRKMLYQRLHWLALLIYKKSLITMSRGRVPDYMHGFDSHIGKVLPKLHYDLGKDWLSLPMLPFRYIRIWRKNPKSRMLQLITAVYLWKRKNIK